MSTDTPELSTASETGAPTEEQEEEEHGLVSGVKVELVDWAKYARPCEVLLLTSVGALLLAALGGNAWMLGYNADFKLVTAGLHWSRVYGEPWDMQTGPLQTACAAAGRDASVACTLAVAGSAAAALGGCAVAVACALAATFIAQALDALGLLGGVRAKLPPALPLATISLYAPAACWALLLFTIFLTLLAYAALSPASLGGGLAYLGSSYGAMRLALLLSLVGLFTHLSLVHKLGEDQVVAMLDTLRGHWGHMARYQQMVQLLLVVALACTALLWIRRVEWSALLLLYGLWAHIEHHHDHLSFFSSAVIFSMCTDALALAADAADSPFIEAVTWVLLGCKLVVVVTLIYQRDAFV